MHQHLSGVNPFPVGHHGRAAVAVVAAAVVVAVAIVVVAVAVAVTVAVAEVRFVLRGGIGCS